MQTCRQRQNSAQLVHAWSQSDVTGLLAACSKEMQETGPEQSERKQERHRLSGESGSLQPTSALQFSSDVMQSLVFVNMKEYVCQTMLHVFVTLVAQIPYQSESFF